MNVEHKTSSAKIHARRIFGNVRKLALTIHTITGLDESAARIEWILQTDLYFLLKKLYML